MTSLKQSNDMLRAIGINAVDPERPTLWFRDEPDYEGDYDERAIMSVAGWDIDATPVDKFMCSSYGLRLDYLQGMCREGDSGLG